MLTPALLLVLAGPPPAATRYDWQITLTTVTLHKQAIHPRATGGSLPLKSGLWSCSYAFERDAESEAIVVTCTKQKGEELVLVAHCSPSEPAYRGPMMALTEQPDAATQQERKRHRIFLSCEERR